MANRHSISSGFEHHEIHDGVLSLIPMRQEYR